MSDKFGLIRAQIMHMSTGDSYYLIPSVLDTFLLAKRMCVQSRTYIRANEKQALLFSLFAKSNQ